MEAASHNLSKCVHNIGHFDHTTTARCWSVTHLVLGKLYSDSCHYEDALCTLRHTHMRCIWMGRKWKSAQTAIGPRSHLCPSQSIKWSFAQDRVRVIYLFIHLFIHFRIVESSICVNLWNAKRIDRWLVGRTNHEYMRTIDALITSFIAQLHRLSGANHQCAGRGLPHVDAYITIIKPRIHNKSAVWSICALMRSCVDDQSGGAQTRDFRLTLECAHSRCVRRPPICSTMSDWINDAAAASYHKLGSGEMRMHMCVRDVCEATAH